MLRMVAAGALVVAVLAGCRGDDPAAGEAATTTTAGSPVAADTTFAFSGDPDSPFCERSRAAAGRPVLDPFEPGLEPDEVEVRFRALATRFRSFADTAPAPLEDDLELLVTTFDELAELLEAAEFDFERLAGADVDLSVFDDPRLARVAARLAAYQEQVCAPSVEDRRGSVPKEDG